jgi:hypothetical protein
VGHSSQFIMTDFRTYTLLALLITLLVGCSTPAAPPERISVYPTIADALVAYDSQSSDATIYYPDGWALREEQNELAFPSFHIAPDAATLTAMTIPEKDGILSFSILSAELIGASPTTTVASLLDLQNRGMADIPGATLTEPTQTYLLGDWEMARQVYRIEGMGDPYVSIQSLLRQGDTYVSASAFAYESQVLNAEAIFDAILSKITIPITAGQ